ncbi:LysR family transcriptional regulator [Clostridium sp. YIM B02515]|uniref:LysR family transcriptional regulator n=1 Tax=Clostridium rhizosphaerae TaxID=2803861 RepID=A0ABS1TGY5_9CLOT|nr:LysR family transcriptional regulator [Clostridium rhizosphaerae]MBL4938352.1 LysR family transcriptional regulator [Clostridium rhizosphaerae]
MLDVRLITFITVARIKSFTKAAEILNLTQPAVSQHIKYLEEYYGVGLIKKTGKEIDLTEEGLILYKYAKELEILYRNLETEIRNKSGIHKSYKVGASMTVGGYVLPYILAEYKREHPNTDMLLQVNNTEEIISKLLNRKLDLALVEGNFDRNKFSYKKFKDDEMVLAVSDKHEFAKKDKVSIEEILKGELIIREKGSGTREIFENMLKELGYDINSFNPYMELGSISAIKSLVEENLGYTIISKETIKRELKQGGIKIVPIEGMQIYREFNFIYLKGSNEKFINEFIKFCYMNA